LYTDVWLEDAAFAGAMPWVLRDVGIRSGTASKRDEGGSGGGSGGSSGARLRLREGDEVRLASHRLVTSQTTPPPFLQEHDLLGLMDAHGIGTDASMATHVSTISERGYDTRARARERYPTRAHANARTDARTSARTRRYSLVVDETGEPIRPPRPPRAGQSPPPRQRGRFLVRALQAVEPELVSPHIRATMESEVSKVARGELEKNAVLERNVRFFHDKWQRVEEQMSQVQDVLGATLRPTRDHLRELKVNGCFPGASTINDGRSNRDRAGAQGRRRNEVIGGGQRHWSTGGNPKRYSSRGG
jgi:hypothetical protein